MASNCFDLHSDDGQATLVQFPSLQKDCEKGRRKEVFLLENVQTKWIYIISSEFPEPECPIILLPTPAQPLSPAHLARRQELTQQQ
jgi:hypothetical protein